MAPSESKPLLVLPLLRDDFPTKDSRWLEFSANILVVLVLTPISIYCMKNVSFVGTLLGLVLAVFLAVHYIRKLMPDWVKERDITGTCSLYENQIVIRPYERIITYSLDSKTSLSVTSNYYQDFTKRKYTHNGLLTFTLQEASGDVFIKSVLLTEEEYEQMIEVLKLWYKGGMAITEYHINGNHKANLLKPLK